MVGGGLHGVGLLGVGLLGVGLLGVGLLGVGLLGVGLLGVGLLGVGLLGVGLLGVGLLGVGLLGVGLLGVGLLGVGLLGVGLLGVAGGAGVLGGVTGVAGAGSGVSNAGSGIAGCAGVCPSGWLVNVLRAWDVTAHVVQYVTLRYVRLDGSVFPEESSVSQSYLSRAVNVNHVLVILADFDGLAGVRADLVLNSDMVSHDEWWQLLCVFRPSFG